MGGVPPILLPLPACRSVEPYIMGGRSCRHSISGSHLLFRQVFRDGGGAVWKLPAPTPPPPPPPPPSGHAWASVAMCPYRTKRVLARETLFHTPWCVKGEYRTLDSSIGQILNQDRNTNGLLLFWFLNNKILIGQIVSCNIMSTKVWKPFMYRLLLTPFTLRTFDPPLGSLRTQVGCRPQ